MFIGKSCTPICFLYTDSAEKNDEKKDVVEARLSEYSIVETSDTDIVIHTMFQFLIFSLNFRDRLGKLYATFYYIFVDHSFNS